MLKKSGSTLSPWLIFIFLSSQTAFAIDVFAEYLEAGKSDTIRIINDPLFLKGVGLKGNESNKPQIYGYLNPFGGAGEPVWEVAQWGSRFRISETAISQSDSHAKSYQDEAKKITVWQQNQHAQIRLEVSGSKEYSEARKAGESWPHLLMEQRLSTPMKINNLTELLYKIDAQLTHCENKMAPGTMKPDLHTAQVTLFLSIQNLNQNSKGYGDYIWFGLPLYDYRYKMIPAYKAQDAGKGDATGKYIYSLASQDLSEKSLHEKKWVHMERDIYPDIKDAYTEAKEKGYLAHTDWNDLRISAMNIGWEIPGTFDAGIQWKALKLDAITNIP